MHESCCQTVEVKQNLPFSRSFSLASKSLSQQLVRALCALALFLTRGLLVELPAPRGSGLAHGRQPRLLARGELRGEFRLRRCTRFVDARLDSALLDLKLGQDAHVVHLA